MQKILWDFEIKTDHLISARRLDLVLNNMKKRIWYRVDFAVSVYYRIKIKDSEKIDKILDLARELKKKKAVEHERDGDANWNWCTWYSHQRLWKKTGGIENQRKNWCCILICRNIFNTIKTSDSSLEKYTSHFIERVVCERELETKQNCNILTPTQLAMTAFLSRSPGLLNRGPGDPVSLGHVLLYPASSLQLIWSPTPLIPNSQSGAWGLPLLGAGFLYSILSPTDWISCALSYIIVQHPPSFCGRHNFALIQPVHGQGYNILIFLDRVHLFFTQVYFLFWQTGWVGGHWGHLEYCILKID